VTWTEAADLLEGVLEHISRLIDGEDLPDLPGLAALNLEGVPDTATVERVRCLLADAEEAMAAISLRRAEIIQELAHGDRLRVAGAGYLRHQ
jgi:hypothetical protein